MLRILTWVNEWLVIEWYSIFTTTNSSSSDELVFVHVTDVSEFTRVIETMPDPTFWFSLRENWSQWAMILCVSTRLQNGHVLWVIIRTTDHNEVSSRLSNPSTGFTETWISQFRGCSREDTDCWVVNPVQFDFRGRPSHWCPLFTVLRLHFKIEQICKDCEKS